MKFKLKENHPFSKKINELFSLMDKEGLSIKINNNYPFSKQVAKLCTIIDQMDLSIEVGKNGEFFIIENNIKYQIEDIEPYWNIEFIPPTMDYKITYEKE